MGLSNFVKGKIILRINSYKGLSNFVKGKIILRITSYMGVNNFVKGKIILRGDIFEESSTQNLAIFK